jgi:hypothetical protein
MPMDLVPTLAGGDTSTNPRSTKTISPSISTHAPTTEILSTPASTSVDAG